MGKQSINMRLVICLVGVINVAPQNPLYEGSGTLTRRPEGHKDTKRRRNELTKKKTCSRADDTLSIRQYFSIHVNTNYLYT